MNRRKSIAVTNQNSKPALKRRAHSIAPGEFLSPASKARRLLAPRKSILKASINIPLALDEPTTESNAESNATQSMDITRTDFQTRVHDNTSSRKSFARRVSFAEHAHVRMFEVPEHNTNSTGSPQSSPASPAPAQGDENAYPGAFRRRSSIRRSWGEESMDMDLDDTAPLPETFLRGSAVEDDDVTQDYGDDMDMTDIIGGALMRRRSSMAPVARRRSSSAPPARRAPLAEVSSEPPEDNTASTSLSEVDETTAEPVEYQIPISHALNPPEKNQAWLALRAVTHSGDTPHSPHASDDEDGGGEQGMELTDAVQRLMKARDSLAMPQAQPEDSFTSTEDSFSGEGDQTINVTGLMRRESSERTSIGRMSMPGTDVDSTMDMTSMYGGAGEEETVNRAIESEPVPPAVFQPQPAIFTAPKPAPPTPQQATIPKPFQFSFTPRPQHTQAQKPTPGSVSPAKARPSAAFAPPAARSSPKKRAAPDGDDGDAASPAKKAAIVGVGAEASKPVPKALSPSKKTPLESTAATQGQVRSSSLRRPSGYFAQRKSLVGGAAGVSPKKLATGRASVAGPGTGDAWTRFDPKQKLDVGKEKEVEREQVPPAVQSPIRVSPTRMSSPAPGNSVELQEAGGDAMPLDSVGADQAMTEQWRARVEEQSFVDDDGPAISVEQFFAMTGVRFIDEIAAPRRSTMHPSQLRTQERDHSPPSTPPPPVPLSEYVTATALDMPQLQVFTHVSKDLQAWIERSRGICAQAEEEALKMTPELFREYVSADEEGQAELLQQLKLIKAHSHLCAKGEWYDWKLQWVEQMYGDAEKGFADLEADAKVIEEIVTRAQDIVPALREEYDHVMRELEQEQVTVAEIEGGDQEYLNELKASIAEQNLEVEALKAEVAESNAKLERLQEKLQELDLEKQEATTAISEARRVIHLKNNSTLAEVIRKRDELEALEELHMWRATKVQRDVFEFIHASRIRVSIPCLKFRPIVDKAELSWLDGAKKSKDGFPQLSDLMLRTSRQLIIQLDGDVKMRTIVQTFRDYWSSCSQLRHQLKLLAIKYPVSIQLLPDDHDGSTGFKATASVLFPKFEGKAHISYIFDSKTMSNWPLSVRSVKCDVRVAYGGIDREIILKAVIQRMEQASPQDNHGCLMDACIEAMEVMDHTI